MGDFLAKKRNEQRLQIIEFYYQDACSVMKVNRALLVFSDEAHFWLNGYVNKLNCRFWSEDQPEALQELPMHPEKVTVWCGLMDWWHHWTVFLQK